MKENYLAIALDKKDIGEADRRYVFFTKEAGLLYIKARGIRRSEAKLAAHVESYILTRISIAKRNGPGTLAGAFAENTFDAMRQDYDVMCEMGRLRKIFIRLMSIDEKDDEIFSLFLALLTDIDAFLTTQKKEKKQVLSQVAFLCNVFLFKIYDLLGYSFPLKDCNRCTKRLENEKNYFNAYEGGFLCGVCGAKISGRITIDADTLKTLRLVSSHNFSQTKKLVTPQKVNNQLQILSDHIAEWIMR